MCIYIWIDRWYYHLLSTVAKYLLFQLTLKYGVEHKIVKNLEGSMKWKKGFSPLKTDGSKTRGLFETVVFLGFNNFYYYVLNSIWTTMCVMLPYYTEVLSLIDPSWTERFSKLKSLAYTSLKPTYSLGSYQPKQEMWWELSNVNYQLWWENCWRNQACCLFFIVYTEVVFE